MTYANRGALRLPRVTLLALVSTLLTPWAAFAQQGTPTYAKDVSRIFQAKCTQCHHAGTGAPMSLTTFDEVRPWARSIRTRVSNREMPPWHLEIGRAHV